MDADTAALEELGRRLWDERRVVTHLLYKLTVTNLLLAADERRFVPDSLREVETTVELLREGEVRREDAVRDLAGRWQIEPDQLTLDELARWAPAPYDHTFADHRDAFRRLAEEVDATAQQNRELAVAEIDEVRTRIDQITGVDRSTSTTYDASGQVEAAPAIGGRLREAL